MAEALSALKEATSGGQRQAKEEQQQLKDANLALTALTEANKVLKRERESLLRTPAFDGREGARVKEKIQEMEENLQETERELWQAKSENAQMKAKLRHGQTYTERDQDGNRDGRGLPTRRAGQTKRRAHA